jgi:hypothetical protein
VAIAISSLIDTIFSLGNRRCGGFLKTDRFARGTVYPLQFWCVPKTSPAPGGYLIPPGVSMFLRPFPDAGDQRRDTQTRMVRAGIQPFKEQTWLLGQ